jgi:hypothetical protein
LTKEKKYYIINILKKYGNAVDFEKQATVHF